MVTSTVGGGFTGLEFFGVDGNSKSMTLGYNTAAEGILHGTWTADNTVGTTSDRRLKKDIRPLYLEMSIAMKAMGKKVENNADSPAGSTNAVSAVLQELRPVAYKLKTRTESKYSHFGFIAQELEEVLPDLVSRDQRGFLSIKYNDLIAVLVLGIQNIDARVWELDAKLASIKTSLGDRLGLIGERVNRVENVIRKVIIAKKQAEIGERLKAGKITQEAAKTALQTLEKVRTEATSLKLELASAADNHTPSSSSRVTMTTTSINGSPSAQEIVT
jgi:hypothetical protein